MNRRTLLLAFSIAVCLVVAAGPARLFATGVPVGGFLPMVGFSLTNKFKNENSGTYLFADPEYSYSGTPLGPGSSAYYDLALLDTGAAVNILTASTYSSFNMVSEGFDGTEPITLSGATGFVNAKIDDPLAIFATGLAPANIVSTAPLVMNTSTMKGLSSTANVSLLGSSDLPNIVGLPFAAQHATYIRNDQPQIVSIGGKTVRTPQIEFLPLGSGAQGSPGTMARAPITFAPSDSFAVPPLYFPNFLNVLEELPLTENPLQPTIVAGGMFLNVNLQHTTPRRGAQSLSSQFLFDTGADVTVMSDFLASQLGFDVLLDEPEFTVSVIGSGGTLTDVPGFFADNLVLPAVGGDLILTNVPIVVLNVPDVSNPVNTLPGIIGTNIFAGRNVVIDPVTEINEGSPYVHFGPSVTTERNWNSAAASDTFGTNGNWSGSTSPDIRGIANVRHVSGGNQTAVVSANTTVWELNVSGSATQTMKVQINSGITLTTFSGINIETRGIVELQNGTLDTQFVEVIGGTLRGSGVITTGSGPIPGQVEIRSGTIEPGNGVGKLDIIGRFTNGKDGTIAVEIGGTTPGTQFDWIDVEGAVAIDGTLHVTRVNLGGGLPNPAVGQRFSIITATEGVSGAFDRIFAPGVINWAVETDDDSVDLVVRLPGDYNDDGIVDAADYTVWRNSFGSNQNLDADGSGNSVVDESDYLVWRQHYGMSFAIGSGTGGLSAVPEPSTLFMLLASSLIGAARRVRRPLAA